MLEPNASIPVNGVMFDYVSGSLTPFFKLKHKDPKIAINNYNDFVGLMNYTKSMLKGYFSWSTLFNAFQEESDGKFLTENNKLNHLFTYSDSGGLQAARRNMIIDDVLKERIYTVQHNYSDIAMTFDEMPFKNISVNAGTAIVGTSSRCYIRDLIQSTAEHSAQHIRKQIEMFDSFGSNTKIVPIIHGFRPSKGYFRGETDNTYVDYAKYMFDKIDNSSKHIHGLSIASLTTHPDNRVGILKVIDYVPRTLASKDIPDENLEHVHLLGLASPQRILPVLALVKHGLIDKRVKRISFDSTAITKAYTIGRVFRNYDEYKNVEQNKDFHPELTLQNYKNPNSKNVRQYYQQVHKYFQNYENYPFNSWEELADHSPNNGDRRPAGVQAKEKGREFELKMLAQVRISSMYLTYVYLDTLERYISGDLTIDDLAHYNTDIAAMYHDIERNATNMHDIFEIVEKHYQKVKAEIDKSVDTLDEFDNELKKATSIQTTGHEEANVLFCDEGKEKASETVKKMKEHNYEMTRGRTNFKRTQRKAHNDTDNISAVDITSELF
jgi:hypothetical protein